MCALLTPHCCAGQSVTRDSFQSASSLLTVLWFASGPSGVQPCRDGNRIDRKLMAGRKRCILLFALRHLHWTDFSLAASGYKKQGRVFPDVTYWDLQS